MMMQNVIDTNLITVIVNGKEYNNMSDSMLQEYIGKDCAVYKFNDISAVKGKLMGADSEWVKIKTKKGDIQLINRTMVMSIVINQE